MGLLSPRRNTMRLAFANEHAARAAAKTLERYGYRASRTGTVVVSDCPALLAVPALERTVGLARVEDFDVSHPMGGQESSNREFGATA
jgi:hypothetical protein